MAKRQPGPVRKALADLMVAGVESIFGITFRHGNDTGLAGYTQEWMRGGTPGSDVLMNQPYIEHPIINQAVSVVAADFASVGWQAFPATGSEKQKATPLPTHPVLEFLKNPAPGMTFRDLMEASCAYYILDGEAYWNYPDVIINPRNMLQGSQLQSGSMEVIAPSELRWDKRGLDPATLTRRSNNRLVDLDTITMFRAFNPYGIRGVGKITPLFHDARADLGAARWNEFQLADRNGQPTIVLKPPSDRGGTQDQREEVRERWERSFPTSKRGIGVTPPGWDVQELGKSLKDMDWTGLRGGAREMILACVGLVPFLAGVLDKANYANAREQKFVYWRGTQARLLSFFEDKINNDFLPKLGITDIKLFPQWELIRAAADDIDQKGRIMQQWFQMGISKKVINETLEVGWNPNDIEDYEVAYLPVNLVPVADIGNTFNPPGDPNEPKTEPPPTAAMEKQQADRRLTLWRLSVLRLQVLEKPVESIMRSWFHSIEQKVMNRLKSLAGAKVARLGPSAGEDDINSLMYDLQEAVAELLNRMTPRIKAALISGGESALSDANLDLPFNEQDFRLATQLVKSQLRVRGISSTVRERLFEELQEGINAGESVTKLAERVSSVMDAAKTRATTIARTEMGTAYNTGRNIAMKQAGIRQHEWLSAKDDRVREDHAADDGEVVDIGTPFPNSRLLYPLDPSGPPEEVINCRCTALPVVTKE